MNKREIEASFRDRLSGLIRDSGLTRSAFAERVGIDRSALSQMLGGRELRLPRAETLVGIADFCQVSIDWLLGLSQSEKLITQVASEVDLEESDSGPQDSTLEKWRQEALGRKIRYVPKALPDLLCLPEVLTFRAGSDAAKERYSTQQAELKVEYSRQPETDMEVLLPMQRVQSFARGEGIWADMPAELRSRQIGYMAELARQLYPTLRLFLFDESRHYASPVTIFGHTRAAFYIGGSYLVLTGTKPVKQLIAHFDGLIRNATVHPHEAADWIGETKQG